jgi:TrmH family RNA methyltransferase
VSRTVLTAAELDRLRVVLIASRNPLNIGAAARAMSNFGALHLRVVQPYDVAFREARSAVDAEPVLTAAEEHATVADAVADCGLVIGTTDGSRRTPRESLQRLEAGAATLRQHLRSGAQAALLFGSEKVGLSNQDLSHCDFLVRIPTRTEHPSMNLGQAVAIVLYEFVRASDAGPTPDLPAAAGATGTGPFATAGDRERLVTVLLAALERSGYLHHGHDTTPEERIRRLIRHLRLSQSELYEWTGLMRQLLWKLENPTDPALKG